MVVMAAGRIFSAVRCPPPQARVCRSRGVTRLCTLGIAAFMAGAPLLGLAAQRPGPSAVVAPVKRLEAGVTVLTHDRAAFARAAQFTIATAPEAVFGGTDGDPAYDLTGVTSVVLQADGGIAAWTSAQHLVVFNPDGTARRIVGRRGQGPGEFAGARELLALAADTLLVTDYSNVRMSWLLPSKGVVRTESLQGRLPALVQRPAGVLPRGRLVMTSAGIWTPSTHPPSGAFRTEASIVVVPLRGPAPVIATVPDVQLKTVQTNFNGRPGVMADYVRYGATAHVVVWDTLIATATGEAYQIDLRNGEGRVVSRIRITAPRRAVTPAMRNARIKEEVDRLRQSLSRGEGTRDPIEAERLFRVAPIADSLAAWAGVLVAPNRTLWLLDPIVPSDTGWTATALRRDGAIIGRLHGPGRAIPVAFGDDRVVLRSADADGVVMLAIHRIVRAPSR